MHNICKLCSVRLQGSVVHLEYLEPLLKVMRRRKETEVKSKIFRFRFESKLLIYDRTRACEDKTDQPECVGSSLQSKSCQPDPCPEEAAWSAWSQWSDCSITCGGGRGTRARSRSCESSVANSVELKRRGERDCQAKVQVQNNGLVLCNNQ